MMVYDLLWKTHAVLMSSAYVSLLTGIAISLFYKKRKWRYKTHRALGIFAGTSGITALLIALVMVQVYSGVHFTSIHAVSGGITGLLLVLTPFIGLRIRKAKNKKKHRAMHRLLGYTTTVAMTVTILFGLIISGILMRIPDVQDGQTITAGGVEFSWEIDGGYLEGTLKAPGEGWIAVGFNPENMMEGADFVIGYVSGDEVFIRDDYGSWLTSHDSDVSLGGSDDIIILGGIENRSGTEIRFRKSLEAVDEFDHEFIPGQEIPVIFAFSDKDSFTGMHRGRGKATIRF